MEAKNNPTKPGEIGRELNNILDKKLRTESLLQTFHKAETEIYLHFLGITLVQDPVGLLQDIPADTRQDLIPQPL